ncbi:MAG: undecaprenyldiphospho-muramoylpentapeptide beta-N- acetylglucosaminyltransferase [Betaproteobacteria bacterium ADurb.Bin341]|nr:MAG: undecaprenyldiphospho-muramoylpentapeptide beta-N- acetylglucosaminyltransferase [Betaproteobacteria bacterium ADurb.Bin341]
MAAPRLVFYAVNGLGLGHVTRLLAIARAVRRIARRAEILFITSSEADGVIYREGFAAVKLPSKTIREQCGLSKGTYLKLAQSVTWTTLSSFNPDVLIVDTYPSGSFEELLPVLRWKQKNVFVFREQREATYLSKLLMAVLPLYDRLIIPHDDIEAVGHLPEPHKAHAVGPILIREKNEILSRAEARRALNLPLDGLLFYGSFGGGGDPETRRALELTAQAIAELPDAHLVLAAGPLLRQSLPAREKITVLSDRYPMLDVLPAFDAAITAAGYNTVHELLFAGIPSVLVPFGRVLDDQEKRVQSLAEQGACLACAPLTESGIREAVNCLTDAGTRRQLAERGKQIVKTNGATAAAKLILELA